MSMSFEIATKTILEFVGQERVPCFIDCLQTGLPSGIHYDGIFIRGLALHLMNFYKRNWHIGGSNGVNKAFLAKDGKIFKAIERILVK
jgi:hypothetical protein